MIVFECNKLERDQIPNNPLVSYGIDHAAQQMCMSLMNVNDRIVGVCFMQELEPPDLKCEKKMHTVLAIVTFPYKNRKSN